MVWQRYRSLVLTWVSKLIRHESFRIQAARVLPYALTPPMGWLAWERFRCNIDCKNDPDNCISENLFMTMAKRIAEDGFKEVGYSYIIIDDCWMLNERDAKGRLQADPERFPHGIKYLADYVHSLGLKLGIYQDIGTKTCIGYIGSQGYEKIDADTFAEWEVDYLKLDGCFKDPKDFDRDYPMVGQHLNATGRKMIYSCSWPAYQVERKMMVNWTGIRENCNLWRNFGDIQDSYESITEIINWFAANQDVLTAIAGPGAFNDPDMLIIGNYGLSLGQCESQMAIWAILASPLMMSNDLRNLRPEFKEILVNRDVIAIDQDPLGIQGRQILPAMQGGTRGQTCVRILTPVLGTKTDSQSEGYGVEVWRRPVLPVTQIANETWASFAVVCWNRRVDGMPFPFARPMSFFGLTHPGGYYVKDLFSKKDYGLMKAADVFAVRIPPAGSIVMFKATLAVAVGQEFVKDQEQDLLRQRLKKKQGEMVGGQRYIHHVLPEYEAERALDEESIFSFALKLLAVICLVLIVLRVFGLRIGLATFARLYRRGLTFMGSSFRSVPVSVYGKPAHGV